MSIDPERDLEIQRDISLSAEALWRGWTDPDTLMKWFCPRPWKVVECDIDLKPGGLFRTVMQSPEGQNQPEGVGTYLVVEPCRRLVWTNALTPDFRLKPPLPADDSLGFFFVVDLSFEPLPGGGTRYRAVCTHQTAAAREAHEKMGFHQGWGVALDQLVELMSLPA
jgi:uncharacterized protein YndB with AHSA1/START domain